MKIGSSLILFVFLYLFNLTISQPSTDDGECDINNEICSGRSISQRGCERRNCCYMLTIHGIAKCVQRKKLVESHKDLYEYFKPSHELPSNEISPPEALVFPPLLRANLKSLLGKEKRRLTPTETIQTTKWLDDHLRHAALEGSKFHDWEITEKGLYQAIIKKNPDQFGESIEFKSGTTVRIELAGETMWEDIEAIVFSEYLTIGREEQALKKEPDQVESSDRSKCRKTKEVIENATVVTVRAYDSRGIDKPVALKLTLNHTRQTDNETHEDKRFSCEFLNESSVNWSSEGCEIESGMCKCNNTSKFLAVFVTATIPIANNISAQTDPLHDIWVLEYILESLSIFCLAAALISLFRGLRRRSKSFTSASARIRERITIHINFVVAIAALHLTRIIVKIVYDDKILCATGVVFSRYFMLVGGMWMLIEGFILHVNVIAKGLKHSKMVCYKFMAGWIIPAVIALTTAAIGFSTGSYIDDKEDDKPANNSCMNEETLDAKSFCWLNVDKNFIWSVTGPLVGIFVINFFILAHTVVFVMWLSANSEALKPKYRKSQSMHHIWHATKGILVLFPILGVPWMVDFYVNISNFNVSTTTLYVQAILNGFQGMSLFILYCGVNREKSMKKLKESKRKQANIMYSPSGKGCGAYLKAKLAKSNNIGFGYNHNLHFQKPSFRTTNQRYTAPGNYQQYFNALQRSRSLTLSGNTGFPRLKTKRNYSVTSADVLDLDRVSPADAYSAINFKQSILDSRQSVVPGVIPEPGEPAMISFSFDDGSKNQNLSSVFKSRWRDMNTRDFRRFSAIPEELRCGIDTIVMENNEPILWYPENKLESEDDNKKTVQVEVHMNGNKISISPKNAKFLKNLNKKSPLKNGTSSKLKSRAISNELVQEPNRYTFINPKFGYNNKSMYM